MPGLDLDLVRTFVCIVDTGSFVAAAARLHVTQAAVSRRVRALEDLLGCSLFVRNKAGASPTAAGRRFQRHAVNLLRTLEQARQELGAPGRFAATLVVGARFGFWEGLLDGWLGRLRAARPSLSVRAEVGFEPDLMHRLVEGSLDLGVMYTPQSRPGLVVERLFDEELVLVGTRLPAGPLHDGYVYVDWGPEFHARHTLAFPDYAGAGVIAGIGWLGLKQVLAHGGSGYFPRRLVAGHVAGGRLAVVDDAPLFRMPAYGVHAVPADGSPLADALALLQEEAHQVAPVARAEV